MNLFVLVSCLAASTGALPVDKAGTKAASAYVNYGCQCDSLTFLDKYGNIQGNCKSIDETGARWCYLPLHGYNTCTDVGHGQASSRFPGRQWSYEACATPPPPAYPQPPTYPPPPTYPQPPTYPHTPVGGCFGTKDGSVCHDKFGYGVYGYGPHGYGRIPTGATANNEDGSNSNEIENNNNGGTENNNNGFENNNNGFENNNGSENSNSGSENGINDFETNNNGFEGNVDNFGGNENGLEGNGFENVNDADERISPTNKLTTSGIDTSRIRFS